MDMQISAETALVATSQGTGRKTAKRAVCKVSPSKRLPASKIVRRKAVGGHVLDVTRSSAASKNSSRDGGGVGLDETVTHEPHADSDLIARPLQHATQTAPARTPDSQEPATIHTVGGRHRDATQLLVASDSVKDVMDMCRQRSAWLKAEMKLTLQCSGICRSVLDNDKVKGAALFAKIEKAFANGAEPPEGFERLMLTLAPLMSARMPLRDMRGALEKLIRKETQLLPAYGWVKSVKGFGDLSFGCIIGETGDLSGYANPAKVWKRMGLAVMSDGTRQRRTSDNWAEHGYAPRRRSVMWNGGNGIIGGMGNGPRLTPGADPDEANDLTPYQRLFVRRIRIDGQRFPTKDGKTTIINAAGETRETFSKHAAARAKRYVEKRVLRDLWRAWRRDCGLPEDEPWQPTAAE